MTLRDAAAAVAVPATKAILLGSAGLSRSSRMQPSSVDPRCVPFRGHLIDQSAQSAQGSTRFNRHVAALGALPEIIRSPTSRWLHHASTKRCLQIWK